MMFLLLLMTLDVSLGKDLKMPFRGRCVGDSEVNMQRRGTLYPWSQGEKI
jgi:hypothetical protein